MKRMNRITYVHIRTRTLSLSFFSLSLSLSLPLFLFCIHVLIRFLVNVLSDIFRLASRLLPLAVTDAGLAMCAWRRSNTLVISLVTMA